MTPDYARPMFGRKRWGILEWKTFVWNDRKICPISMEFANAVGWNLDPDKLVVGPYRLKIISVAPERETIYGLRVSNMAEEFSRRILIFIGDVIWSLFRRWE